jgi:hypothetical protein
MAMFVPALLRAEVNAGAGNIVLLGHIDFVGRYSAQDDAKKGAADDWPGYQTYNLEFAVLGIAGQVGDNVDWVITESFAFIGPFASLNSALAQMGGGGTNMVAASLLDARVNFHLGDSIMLSAGRFIPPTSMTWNPHLLKAMYTINYPLINGAGLQGFQVGAPGLFIPMPMYQTGVMLTAKMGPASLMIGNYNGTDIVGGSDIGGVAVNGMNNTMDIDKTKGTSIKLAVDNEGLHCGGWYYWEEASLKMVAAGRIPPLPIGTLRTADAAVDQWGLELAYDSDLLILQSQYLSTKVNFQDSKVKDLFQSGWYVLLGAHLGEQVQVVARYDYFDYDNKKVLFKDKMDTESATTLGVNYLVNGNTMVGLDYTFRNIEDWDANTDELAVIVEVNLF